jgi:hypothetical protein
MKFPVGTNIVMNADQMRNTIINYVVSLPNFTTKIFKVVGNFKKEGRQDIRDVSIYFNSNARTFYKLYNKIIRLCTDENNDDEYRWQNDGVFTLIEIPTVNPQLQEQKDSMTNYNCAVEIIKDEIEPLKENKNKKTILRKIKNINDAYYETGINNEGLQQLSDATSIKIVIGDKKGIMWHTFDPIKRDGTNARIYKTLYLQAHNNHISRLPPSAKIINDRTDYETSIFDRLDKKNMPETIFVDQGDLSIIGSFLAEYKINYEVMLSKTEPIAIISDWGIYKTRFYECELYPDSYTDAGVGRMKFLKQRPEFIRPKTKSFELTNIIGDASNQCGFYMRLGKSSKDNIKYDMNQAYKSFRDSGIFKGFPIIDQVYNIEEYNEIDQIIKKYKHGMIYVEYPKLTLEALEKCEPIYLEGSQWYPVELLQAILPEMPKDKRALVKFMRYAVSTYNETFDVDFNDFTNHQFRGFVGKCESKLQESEWSTTDPVEYIRAKYILNNDVTNVRIIKQTDLSGNPFKEYRITFRNKVMPWRCPIIASYIKHHQRYNLFKKYNEVMRVCDQKNPIVYIAVDSIEFDRVTHDELNIANLFKTTKWKVENIKISKSVNRVIEREIPDITMFNDSPQIILGDAKYGDSIKVKAILGAAGCGKSYKILSMSEGSIFLGPTNGTIQALKSNAETRNIAIQSATIHKAFGIQCKETVDLSKYIRIIIDEISMVSLEMILKLITQLFVMNWRGELYLVGDFKQLQPVGGNPMYVDDKFDSKLLDLVSIDVEYLTTNYRQNTDKRFYKMCQELRDYSLTKKSLRLLNKQVRTPEEILEIEKQAMTIAGVNSQVDAVNSRYDYKSGIPVVMIRNLAKKNICNGNIFMIDTISMNEEGIEMATVSRSNKAMTMTLEKLKTISKIAKAITIHKCQGMTISDKLIINPTRLFDISHLYVAITRSTELKNIFLTSPIEQSMLPRRQDKYIELIERFDQHKLNHIVKNEEEFRKKMSSRSFENGYNPFTILKKYLSNSKKGVMETMYRQRVARGRFYAVGSLSLQSIVREIRHTIAADYYNDIDVKNCHPNIMAHLCKLRGIECKILNQYNANRDEFLQMISPDKDTAKIVVLTMLNGGEKAFRALKNPPEILTDFKTELKLIHTEFAKDPAFDNHKDKKISAGVKRNHEASYTNTLLCDFENRILQTIHKGVGSPKDSVLCFDGMMIRKDVKFNINDLEKKVFDELGMAIELALKPMNEGFEITNIEKYNDDYEYTPDEI